jgi:prephenate dehydratase
MRTAYLGPEGTVSHEALLAADPHAAAVPLATLRDVVLAVQERRLERALVPVENALEGGVDPVLDALGLDAPDVRIVGELIQPVSYCLAAAAALPLDAIREVISHPQASGQCARFLRTRLAHAAVVAAASTADAVRGVAAGGEPGPRRAAGAPAGAVAREPAARAALGTRFAAERYGAVVLADAVEDDPGNATRFAWLAPADAAPEPPADGPPASGAKTALVFWGAGSASPGWLVDCLMGFAEGAVNLTRIESRPLRKGMGEYMFFLDLEGSIAEPRVADAIARLRRHAGHVRVLGSFPAAAARAG